MNTGLIFQDNPLFFLKRIFMLESQKMLPSRQQAFCFFACLPEREHIIFGDAAAFFNGAACVMIFRLVVDVGRSREEDGMAASSSAWARFAGESWITDNQQAGRSDYHGASAFLRRGRELLRFPSFFRESYPERYWQRP